MALPETCAFDLVRYPEGAGHLSNAATVLVELAERLDERKLVDVAPLVRLPDVQRLGYLLDVNGLFFVPVSMCLSFPGSRVTGQGELGSTVSHAVGSLR